MRSKGLLLVLLGMLGAAPPAHGQEPQLPDLVVQERDSREDRRDPDGIDLFGHRWEILSRGSSAINARLTLFGKPTSADNWDSLTFLDLDRDGRADVQILVTNRPRDLYGQGYVDWNKVDVLAIMQELPAANTSGNCVAPEWPPVVPEFADTPREPPLIDDSRQTMETVNGTYKRMALDFVWKRTPKFLDLPALAPVLTTVAVPGLSALRAYDEVPDRAGSGVSDPEATSCWAGSAGLVLDVRAGSDRGVVPGAAPVARQAFADPEQTGVDLLGGAIESWEASRDLNDATTLSDELPHLARPADLLVRLPKSGAVDAGAVIAPGYFDLESADLPLGVLDIELGAGDSSKATVRLRHAYGRTLATDSMRDGWLIHDPPPWCYLGASGSDAWTVELPVVAEADGRLLRIPIDIVLGELPASAHAPHHSEKPFGRYGFRWAVFAKSSVGRDYVPDQAGPAEGGVCGISGTLLDPKGIPLFERPIPGVALTATPANDVERGQQVLLEATHTSSRPVKVAFDTADGRFEPSAGLSKTASFQRSYTARVTVEDDRGVLSMAERRISIDNEPPKAVITINGQAPKGEYGLAPGGTTLNFNGAGSTDDDTGLEFAWRLEREGGGSVTTRDGLAFSSDFEDEGRWTLSLTVTDFDGASSTATIAFVISGAAPPPKNTLLPIMQLNAPDAVTLGADGRAPVTLDATGSTGRNEDPSLTFHWDFDGNGTYDASGGSPRIDHAFTRRGAQKVRVLGIDNYGNSALAEREVLVRDAILDASCPAGAIVRTVSYGPLRATGCFTRIEREGVGLLWIASGRVNLNGLIVTGTRGSAAEKRTFEGCESSLCKEAVDAFNDGRRGFAIALDVAAGRLVSSAPVGLTAEGTDINFPLSVSALDITLPYGQREDGFRVQVPDTGGLFGMPIDGWAEVRFPAPGETEVRVGIKGPEFVLPFDGHVKLRATSASGTVVDQLRANVHTGLIGGKIVVKQLVFTYDRKLDLWAGSGLLAIPTPTGFDVGFSTAIQRGQFKSMGGSVAGINRHVGKGIYFQGLRFNVAVDPVDLTGGVTFSIGPKIPLVGRTVVSGDGNLNVSFPTPQRTSHLFSVNGKVKLLDHFELGHALVQFADDGATLLRGGVGGEYVIGYFNGILEGWFDATLVNLDGTVEAGLLVGERRVALAGARGVVSTRGVAACGTIPIINLGGGLGFRWGKKGGKFTGCDLSPYSEARPKSLGPAVARAAQAQTPLVVPVARGTSSVAISVEGSGGAPKIRLVSASGETVLDAGGEALTAQRFVQHDEANNTTTILWKAPPAGDYAVVALPRSPRVERVLHALPRPQQRVTARVRGTGARRTLSWRVRPALQRDQRLLLVESGKDGGRTLVTTRRSRGERRFRPAPGTDMRSVMATVESAELAATRETTVARFRPPRVVRPAAPRRLRLVRDGRRVEVRFAPPRGAGPSGYLLTARIGGSRIERVVAAAARAVTLEDVAPELGLRVQLRAMTVGNLRGRPARAALAAGAVRSGGRRAADARPRAVRVHRRGRAVTVSWHRGPEALRGYLVVVRARGRALRVPVHPRRSSVRIARAPRGRVSVLVRALRHGAPPVQARASG